MTITVSERGRTLLGASDWRDLAESTTFWQLIDAGVVSARALPNGTAMLEGSHLVGRAKCGDRVLECEEKVPGALLSLLREATPQFRALPAPSPGSPLGETISLLVSAFVDQVRDYTSAGREWLYTQQRETGSVISGRLHVPSTAQLRARGLRHLASFDRTVITRRTELNRLTLAALREVEVLARLVPVSSGDLAGARACALFFGDCQDAETLFASGHQLSSRAHALLAAGTVPPHLQLMLELAAVLLSHRSFEAGSSLPEVVPVAWFVNLENLFERAVRACMRRAVMRPTTVTKAEQPPRHVFPGAARLAADPDLIVREPERVYIGDVKYKDWAKAGSASDLYQLLAHATTFDADVAFLAYPAHHFEATSLGTSSGGVEAWLFALPITELEFGVRRMCHDLGVEIAPQEAVDVA